MTHRPFSPVLTRRLRLRAPRDTDAASIFDRYASDREVVKYVGWPRHATVSDSHAFLRFAESEWARWPLGPLMIEDLASGRLLGSTGLAFDDPDRASTGYVFARDAWGRGYATEALAAVVDIARTCGVRQVYALCHPAHVPSRRVLERCSFRLTGIRPKYLVFPNLEANGPQDVCCYELDVSLIQRSDGANGDG